MAAIVSLAPLLEDRRLWRGQPLAPAGGEPTGYPALDAALPYGGWPPSALSEILLTGPGQDELQLLLPTLVRLTRSGGDVALVSPPYLPFPQAWAAAGVDVRHLRLVQARPQDMLWAVEQCLRAGCLPAVLCWPCRVDDKALRRLQVAAEAGRALGFVFRDSGAAANASPAALRLRLEDGCLRVLKCRGGQAPARAIPLPRRRH